MHGQRNFKFVKESVELYLYSPSVPSWPVLGWPLLLPLPFIRFWMNCLLYRNPLKKSKLRFCVMKGSRGMAPLIHFSVSPLTAHSSVMIRSLFVLVYEITCQILTPKTMQILALDFYFLFLKTSVKKNKMSGVCSTNCWQESCVQG